MLRLLLVAVLLPALRVTTPAAEYLSGSEIVAVGSASAGIFFAGERFKAIPLGKKPLITGHLPFEQSLQRWLGGAYALSKKRNFLDSEYGAFLTPLASGLALSAVNLGYPRGSRSKDFSEDLFLFVSGSLATKGITDLAKGFFARERPLLHVHDDNVATESMFGRTYLQHSFFSGHTSSAFFSVGFLNLRIRETMRRRMTKSEYRGWRWVSSGMLYGWASFVGLTRVQAYKHHLSDVVVGAVAGVLLSELFFNFGKSSDRTEGNRTPLQFQVTIPF